MSCTYYELYIYHTLHKRMRVRHVCMCGYVHVCVCACVHVRARAYVCV